MTVATFNTLCGEADFLQNGTEPAPATNTATTTQVTATQTTVTQKVNTIEPNIYLNLQIHIAPDMSEDKIEAVFKHMRRYLLTNE